MKATGATNPINTGTAQTSQASPQRTPRNGTGKASVAAAWPGPAAEKRMRRWARCSSHSSPMTSASSMVGKAALPPRGCPWTARP